MLLNPLIVVSLVVTLMTTGWILYTGGTSNIAQARPSANLMPALDSTAQVIVAASGPTTPAESVGGWTVNDGGGARTALALTDGQMVEHALRLDITEYNLGDVTLTSPRVDVEQDKTYLFKAYTASEVDFTLLARHYHRDGSTTLKQLRHIKQTDNSPVTVSDAFDSGDATTAVEYVLRFASKGTVLVEGAYLEAADDVHLPSAGTTSPNLLPNPGLTGTRQSAPESWTPYGSGSLSVESGRAEDEDGSFLWTRIAKYESGEAKWQYQPVPVTPDGYYEFGATYQSEREVDVVAEFELTDGGREFLNLATVPPAGEWTTIREAFQIPEDARKTMVTLVSHGDGTTGVRDYSLIDNTKPGPVRWERPMVSITFDDGWQSVYDRALPLLDKHGFRSTQYVNASSIETPGYMTATQLKQIHENGHEIAAHAFEHVDLTSISADRLDDEVRKSDEALAAAGLGTDDLAPPFGRSDPQVDWYASKYFDIMRGTDQGINTRQNLDPRDLKVFFVTEETTPDSLAAALAETTRVNGWLILVYHQIGDSESIGTQEEALTPDRSTVSSTVLAEHLQLIADSGIEVQPVAQAFEQVTACDRHPECVPSAARTERQD